MKKLFCAILACMMLLSLTACGDNGNTTGGANNTPLELNLSEIYTTITKDAQMPEMMQLETDMLLDLFGIRAEYCNQAVVYMCVNSLRADEIWLLEAKDAESLAALKNLAQARLDQKDAESVTYSPEQNAVVKAAQVIEAGNYFVMIVSPDAAAIAGAFRTAAGI